MSVAASRERVDLILNVDAITPPLSGIGRYALRLATGLRTHPAVGEVRYFSAYKWVGDPRVALTANRTLTMLRRWVPAKSAAIRAYFALRQRRFDQLTRRLDGYVLHCPNYLLFEHTGPRVCTVHDLSWLHYPQYHPAERVRILHERMPRSLEIADAVITDSQFVRDEVIRTFALDPARVHAVPLGVDETFRPHSEAQTRTAMTAFGLRHGDYLLALATLEPRKNLDRLLDAYECLDASLRRHYPLVLIGAIGWHADRLVERIDALAARGEAKRLGYVDEATLLQLVAGARALAFPSVYEGFGLPPLEAMASGVPVVASSASCIPEVTADAALLVPPDDTGRLTTALEQALVDAAWRDAARARGIARAREFTWQRCVDATVRIYRNVAAARH
ncbi:MAG: glycosyltransferase family 1 protein [Rudaea sp.]|uniref:glycosyltransferase family 4 protein n=1 Tax=Rudaea sp. TaxID=2136325 RepID=UPI0039E4D82E